MPALVAVKRAEADGHTLPMQYSGYYVITPHVSKQQHGTRATCARWPTVVKTSKIEAD